ncbi:MAG: hypothetical protein HY657_03770 [Acidobacteria bacterium]|nr:hypothetical protein [Acidobacteriota bacterium]
MGESSHNRLRIFLSVDTVGSTAFKQGQENLPSGPRWVDAFRLFYSRVGSALFEQWRRPPPDLAGDCPTFWKGLGDEVLYVKELTDYRQAFFAVRAWRDTVGSSRATLANKYPSLDLKASAWVANFPITNAEIQLPMPNARSTEKSADVGQASTIDYIGPSMDLGFRLGTLSSPTRLVTSVGLTLMVAEAVMDGCADADDLRLMYGEPTILKGVLGGAPYPAFWVDTRSDRLLADAEDHLLGKPVTNLQDIITVCRRQIAAKPGHFYEPYIDPMLYPKNQKFNVVPALHRSA